MKKVVIMFLTISFIFSSFNIVHASGKQGKLEVNSTKEFDYSFNEVDWDEIDRIIVLYSDVFAPFIMEAQNQGIEIIFDNVQSTIRPRSYTYFSSITWMERDGELALSVNPRNPHTVSTDPSWRELLRYFQYHTLYRQVSNPSKENSMYNQYRCHVHFARGFKTPWNLEPEKPDKGYWGFVRNFCN